MAQPVRSNDARSNRAIELRVVHTALFWETLHSYRNSGQYQAIRSKLRELVAHRTAIGTPHPRESIFALGALKGIWHFHLLTKPDIILFHSVSEGVLSLHMVGDHTDYTYNRKHRHADQRTRNRIDRSVHDDIGSPLWPGTLRWTSPAALAAHPDLPEMAPEALEAVQNAIEDELESMGRRWNQIHRRLLEKEPKAVTDAYLEDLVMLSSTIEDIQTRQLGAHYDRLTSWTRVDEKQRMP